MKGVAIIVLALLALVGAASAIPPASAGGAHPSTSSRSSASHLTTVLLAPRTKRSGCHHGPLPDRRCSPGAYYKQLTKQVICSSGFHTSSIRDVPQSEKFAAEREYGMKEAYYGFSIELDHIVPLELGGSNSIANIFPEPGKGPDSYHAKDKLENELAWRVCHGEMSLSKARQGIASNWEKLYRRVFGQTP